MIQAVRDYALGRRSEPPEELQSAWKVRDWGLPDAGGWRDQVAGELEKWKAAESVYNAYTSWKNRAPGDLTKWKKDNPAAWELIKRYGY